MIPLVTALMLAAPQASADEARWRGCIDRTKTNYEWAACGGDYVKRADAALNAEWKRLLASAMGKNRADLVAEERAWIAYREKACRFYANGEQGREGQVLHFQYCLARVIEQRTAALAGYRSALAGPR